MRTLSADVVVIGGGTTGVGVLRDLAMRGHDAILVERADLAQGTSGRFHGLLHSGGRYVVSDALSAAECAAENAIVTRIQPGAVETTGGLFVCLPGDDPAFGDRFLEGAKKAGVWAKEITPAHALELEPRLNPGLSRAFEVHDGSVDGWQIVWSAAASARDHGAQVLTYHEVVGIESEQGHVTQVRVHDRRGGETLAIDTRFVLNCAGPWAGKVAALAGLGPVEVVPGRGIMIAMNHRLVHHVINRCIPPADGDILVPNHTVCIIGTTDIKVEDPDHLEITREEVQQMLDAGEAMIPGFRSARALRAWTGARPLIRDSRVAAGDTRHMSRGMQIMDHQERDGLGGMLTVGGGKLTTYRLMAEHVVDAMEDQIGEHNPCRTAAEPCPSSGDRTHRLSRRHADREQYRRDGPDPDPVLCECELMTKSMFTKLAESQPLASLDDLRRQLRFGMGPCQGGFCSTRLAALTLEQGHADAERATELLRAFLAHRWQGLTPILHGDQLRQACLDHWILQGILDLAHLPAPSQEVV
ncbi:MAG: anaerobic glycerol-3-phosphate dehydrogenase subunit GlpA [Micrococcales bacterium]|nr:anaerobic glycerol-3-phosphate dehydrogenase subunit GlpA [Micrococcales bacterium]